ncbi:hypothetical protein [Flavobacterium undicola]|uniref:hypothetical protein n=1 Tax=Flavobacterium undicola TaxID=1932779 RepID=UPI001376DB1B|nr:hypothetical protein [Flavobacterium undicola]MBA0885348.1 hypothetical protein [Flavobacterium undicola]
MRKCILLFIVSLTFLNIRGQATFEHNYLGEEFTLYKGSLLKLIDNPISGFNYAFYPDLKYCQSAYDNNVIYPDTKYNFVTVKDSLKNRIFVVEDIIDKTGKEWNEASKTDYFAKPLFVLKDTLSGQKIYYKYDKEYEHNFPFNTSKINYPTDYFCSKIDKQIDEFTNEIKFSSPIMSDRQLSPTIIYKYINKGKSVYYLSLRTYGSTVNVNETGVIILFQDGTKWSRASKIDVEAESNSYQYSAFITLTPADLITFSTKKIKKFRLYIYDEEVNSSDAEKFKLYTKCIKTAK